MAYKRPVSILVVIYAQDTKRVLMLQRRDDPDFWQSVTGSVEEGETAPQAVLRFRTSARSFSLNIWLTSGLMRLLRRRSLSPGATGRRLNSL